MNRLTQISLAFVLPLTIFMSFHLIYSKLEKHDKHKTCIYLNNSICIIEEKNSNDVKSINLNNYHIDTSKFKTGRNVNYETDTIKSQQIRNYLIVLTICLLLGIVIAFPSILVFIFEVFSSIH